MQGIYLKGIAPSAGGLVKGHRVALIEGATLAVLSAEPHACKHKNRQGRCEAMQHLLQEARHKTDTPCLERHRKKICLATIAITLLK